MKLNFEPHSFYKGFAIRDNRASLWAKEGKEDKWEGYIDNGNTYRVVMQGGATLKELKQNINEYHARIAERDAYNRRMIGEK